MSLLAYALRRAWGALVVLLVVIWLLLFAVAHIGPVPYHPLERGPLFELPWNKLQPELARTWNLGALEVVIAAVVLLGVLTVWRRWTPPFLALVATGSVLLAFGVASFGVVLANQDYRRLHIVDCLRCPPTAIQESLARKFNRGIDPTPWWIAGGISTSVGVLLVGVSVTAHRRAAPR